MAAADHNPSRRALLGAAVALPLVPASSFRRRPETILPAETERRWTPDQVRGDAEWDKGLAAFEAAQTAVWEIEAATAGYGFDEEEALLPAHEAACEAMETALGRLLLVPAPDLAAFATKLDLFFEHELEPHSAEDDVLAAIREDVGRLAGMA
jgi:hypothetical protein